MIESRRYECVVWLPAGSEFDGWNVTGGWYWLNEVDEIGGGPYRTEREANAGCEAYVEAMKAKPEPDPEVTLQKAEEDVAQFKLFIWSDVDGHFYIIRATNDDDAKEKFLAYCARHNMTKWAYQYSCEEELDEDGDVYAATAARLFRWTS